MGVAGVDCLELPDKVELGMQYEKQWVWQGLTV